MIGFGSLTRSLVLIVALLGTLVGAASGQDAPPIPKGVTVVNGDQVKKMLDGKEKFLLVDSRNSREYKEGHLPSAVHVYDKDMESQKDKFPADKAHPIVFYCNGYPKCPRSANAATIARRWGYTKLSVYVEGFPEWEAKGYPIQR
jgi:rhodanese-related sulfurtransferase